MIQKKLTGYRPNYPRKALRSAAMTAAALVAMGGVTGCRLPISSRLQTSGIVPMPEPTDQELVLDGEVAIIEPTEEELRLPGEPYIEEPEPTPEVPLRTTGVLLMPSATPEA